MTIITTTTEYMAGFQYTNNVLDFFPHPEGYAKAIPAVLGGGSGYQFKYVFTYTDHLGNIRLKYAQDPSNNNQISILEEDPASVLPRLRERTGGGIRNTISYNPTLKLVPKLLKQSF